jgi:hypothetical protein
VVTTSHGSVGIREGSDGQKTAYGDQRLLFEPPCNLLEARLIVEVTAGGIGEFRLS